MNQIAVPIVMLVLCFGAMAAFFIMSNRKCKKVKTLDKEARAEALHKTAQEFVNIRDIKEDILYTEDNYLISYVKIQPISPDLLTRGEQKQLAEKLTDEFSQIRRPYKFLAVSRPIDIGPLLNQYSEIMSASTDQVQKELLRKATRNVSEYSLSGDVVQREFFYMIWERNEAYAVQQLKSAARKMVEHIENAGMKGEILCRSEIIKLCNLVNNPAFATMEDTSVEASIPYLSGEGV